MTDPGLNSSEASRRGDLLEGARTKLARAYEHFEELKRDGHAFLQSGAYRVEQRENPDEPGALQWVARVTADPPARLAAVIGDVVHNARAALDLAVWQLVLANGAKPTTSTCFPITNTAKEFETRLAQATAGISAAGREAIERARPYDNLNLHRLHRLDIADKHRLLVTVGAANRSVGFKLPLPSLPGQTEPIESPTIFLRPADRLFPIKDGDVVAGISAQARAAGDFDPPVIVFELAFGDEETVRGEPVAETLDALLAEVHAVIEALSEAVS